MFGWRFIRESELARQAEYIAKCERLIEHERERIDMERERADRIADSLFQQNGLPPTSATVVREQQAAEKIADEKREDYMKQLMEIFNETESDMLEDGATPLPEEIAETVK